jgi:hypothetical protein
MSEETPAKVAPIAQVVDRVLALGMFVELDRLFAALFGIPADALTERRVKRLTRIQEMREQKAALLGVKEPKALPEKVAQEVLTGAAVEEDEDMQELWANLLANHDAGMEINSFLVDLLKKLDGRTAKVLLYFWDKAEAVRPELAKATDRESWLQIGRKRFITDGELKEQVSRDWAVAERVRLQAMGLVAHIPTATEAVYYVLHEIGVMLCKALVGPKA